VIDYGKNEIKNRGNMYSVWVKQHYLSKGYAICIAIKQDGIDESSRNLKLHTEIVNALLDFEGKVAAIIKATQGRKDNEQY